MYISLNVLKKFVDLEGIKPQEISDELTGHSFEVDDVVNKADSFKNIIVGRIEKVSAHKSADKLRVCDVCISETGKLLSKKKEIVQIICGGSNLEKGMHVVVAIPGSFVKWHGEGDLVEIKETELRGEKSYGMICASDEIGLSDIFPAKSEKEIIDLDSFKDNIKKEIKVGENIATLLDMDSVCFDVDNIAITHRPDLWGHYGVARELSVIYKKELKKLELDELKNTSHTQLKVEVLNTDVCKNYNAVKINNIKIESSPDWLRDAMLSTGHNSINNIVDLTNYIMIELGQPLHAFDASKISNKIFVRNAKAGEKMELLDGKKIDLDESTLVISDSIRPIGIAGVMGGAESSISNGATSIVVESATFDAVSVRKTMQRYGIRTDAGSRYEKQLDPKLADVALARFVYLLKKICPKASLEEIQSQSSHNNIKDKTISISYDFIKSRIGADIPKFDIIDTLTRLGFTIDESEKDYINVTVPFFRNKDINIKEDIVEEIARIYGYNNIEPAVLSPFINSGKENGLRNFERRVKEIMIDNGFSEVLNYSFISENDEKTFGFNNNQVVKLLNSLSVDQDRMKPVLAINLIKNIKDNLKNLDNIKIFEIERIFRKDIESDDFVDLPFQHYHFSAFFTEPDNEIPFYSIKNYLNKIFSLFKLDIDYTITEDNVPAYCHPFRYAKLFCNDTYIGYISEVNPSILIEDKIKQRVSFFELDFEELYDLLEDKVVYENISKYQGSSMDISMIINNDILWKDVKCRIKNVSPFIRDIKLFDVYNGEKIGSSKTSLTFRISLVDNEKTMTSEIIDDVYNNVSSLLKNEFNAEIRK